MPTRTLSRSIPQAYSSLMFIDTHSHITDESFYRSGDTLIPENDPRRLPIEDGIIARAAAVGVGIMLQADIDIAERQGMFEACRRHPGVLFPMLGLYPGSVTRDTMQAELDAVAAWHANAQPSRSAPALEANAQPSRSAPAWHANALPSRSAPAREANAQPSRSAPAREANAQPSRSAPAREANAQPARSDACSHPAPVAVGEIGLDYHYGRETVAEQREAFAAQLELALAWDLPVNIHLREATEDFFDILASFRGRGLRGNLHAYSGSYESFCRLASLGDWYVGIGGVVTFKKASLAEVVRQIPLDRILLETDAPYLAPTPLRGTRNESANIPLIASFIAGLKNITPSEVEAVTTANARTLFGL